MGRYRTWVAASGAQLSWYQYLVAPSGLASKILTLAPSLLALMYRLGSCLDRGTPGRFPMLPPFIIEQIRRREEKERAREQRQPRLEVPLDRPPQRAPKAPEEQGERGVVVIDLMNEDP